CAMLYANTWANDRSRQQFTIRSDFTRRSALAISVIKKVIFPRPNEPRAKRSRYRSILRFLAMRSGMWSAQLPNSSAELARVGQTTCEPQSASYINAKTFRGTNG